MSKKFCFLSVLILLSWMEEAFAASYLSPTDILKLPSEPITQRFYYGTLPLQFGELRVPKGKGPFPVVIVIHGGCWLSKMAGPAIMAPLESALMKEGIATWSVEYRGIDKSGGGWPGTYQDVAAGVNYLKVVAQHYPLNLNKVIILGHSAGGQLALWVSAKTRLPILGVIDLAGPPSLKDFYPLQESTCGEKVITAMMGGSPEEKPENYRQASPIEMLPLGVKQILIVGDKDNSVPARLAVTYQIAAQKMGDKVTFIPVKNAAHFELISPNSAAWPIVNQSILNLLGLS